MTQATDTNNTPHELQVSRNPDARLVALLGEWRSAELRHEEACRGSDACAAADEASAAVDAVVRSMAATPAMGLRGIAAKAGILCGAVQIGASIAEMELADSLIADLARLAPEVVA